jgi:hypothetical protein
MDTMQNNRWVKPEDIITKLKQDLEDLNENEDNIQDVNRIIAIEKKENKKLE